MSRYLQTIGVITVLFVFGDCIKLTEKFAWQELSYAWPNEEAKQEAIKMGAYKIENNLPLGLDIWQDKLFITVPRWKAGVASSLNYVKITDNEKSPVLHPYPSWEANTLESSSSSSSDDNKNNAGDDLMKSVETSTATVAAGRANAPKAMESNIGLKDNSSIISTFRIRVDECDRLWVMDTGLADILGNPKQIAPPALVIYDLLTDRLIRRFNFPEDNSKEDTFFANVIVDVERSNCDNAYAYIPDLGAYGVVVYSFKENKSWRVKHNYFHFDPLNGDYNIGGVNFQWTDGVFGMAVGKMKYDGTRPVYFHALSSTKEFEVSNHVLQNMTRADEPAAYFDYKLLGDRGQNGQSSAEFYDEQSGVLFYTQVNKDGIGCWNSEKPYTAETQGLVDTDSDSLVFPNDLKIDAQRNLWVLSDRMPVFLYKTLNPKEFNYRILTAPVNDAIQGTPCA